MAAPAPAAEEGLQALVLRDHSHTVVYASYSVVFRGLAPGLLLQARKKTHLQVFGFARHSAAAAAERGTAWRANL